MKYYPVMLELKGKPVCMVGGGKVAERKTAGLLEAGAHIAIVSPELTPGLEELAADGLVTVWRSGYVRGMVPLRTARLVFAATADPEVNRQVVEEAEALGIWSSCADEGSRGDFIVPAALRRGKLAIAVSTSGASPGLARQVRDELEAWLGDGYAEHVELLYELRTLVRRLVDDPAQRQELLRTIGGWRLRSLIAADSGGSSWEELRGRLLAEVAAEPTVERLRKLSEELRLQTDEDGQ